MNSFKCLRLKIEKNVLWNDFPSFLTCIFYIFPSFTPGKQPYFETSEMTTQTPCARDIWWTLDLASAFLSPGVNSRAELVPSPRARNGAPRRWLGDYPLFLMNCVASPLCSCDLANETELHFFFECNRSICCWTFVLLPLKNCAVLFRLNSSSSMHFQCFYIWTSWCIFFN